MQQRNNHVVEMLKGTLRFLLDNSITLAAVTNLHAEITACITNYQAAAAAQIEGSLGSAGGVETKQAKYTQLRAYMKDVARVGRALDRDLYPGLAEHFILPDTRSYPALLAAAGAMIECATPHEPAFVAHGLPATFLGDLRALITAFHSAANAKIDGKLTQVGGTSAMRFWAKKGVEAARKLDAIIRAHFRNDPVTLEIWSSARHIQAPPQRSGVNTPSPSTSGEANSRVFPGNVDFQFGRDETPRIASGERVCGEWGLTVPREILKE